MQEVTCENIISILELLCLFMAMNIAKFEASRASFYCSYMLLYSKTTVIFFSFFLVLYHWNMKCFIVQ